LKRTAKEIEMFLGTSVLCPVDFSESSRGALRYAAVIASGIGARLTLLAVNDPMLLEASELTAGGSHLAEETVREVKKFVRETCEQSALPSDLKLQVATGKPAPEILRHARDLGCDLIVMGSHGATGFRKLFFGSTTERVLRETTVPVLVTPGTDPGPLGPEDVRKAVRRVLVPVDLTAATPHQLAAARATAEELHVPLLLLHVIEPVRTMASAQARLPKIDAERRFRAEEELAAGVASMPAGLKVEALVAYGEPAEEIAKIAADREAGLIVMGLHSSPLMGPRMGSVTYRVLCLAHRLVLALPPQPAAAALLNVGTADTEAAETSSR
jgi:nucleotide-binding universal stress UspA family protein